MPLWAHTNQTIIVKERKKGKRKKHPGTSLEHVFSFYGFFRDSCFHAYTTHAFDKKTADFAQGPDFLREIKEKSRTNQGNLKKI